MSRNDPQASRTLRAALAAAGDIAYEWDLASDALSWCGPIGPALGIADPAALGSGSRLAGRIEPADLAARQRLLAEHLASGTAFDCEYRLRGEDGRWHWVHDRGRAEHGAAGGPGRVLGILRVVTARKAAALDLEQRASCDPLTGLPNLPALRAATERAIAAAAAGQGPAGAYLALGIDNMAMVNDAFGCAAADAALVAVAHRLEQALGATDRLGRIGGDRFGVLLADCGEAALAGAAERLRAAISERPVFTRAGPIYLTASLGCLAFPRQAASAEDAMTRAETALAEAKRAGRDCAATYRLGDADRADHRAGMAIGEQVQRALREGRLLFAYQPVVGSGDRAVDYYECLLRLRAEDGTILAAGRFVPMIEKLGLIRNIDEFVLERAVAELRGAPGFALGINISGLTATHQPWLRSLTRLIGGAPELARRLVIEITETAALRDLEESARFVRSLRELGCRVALDDFGAGFTSLRHLQTLALDILKIDGSFVRNLVERPDSQAFLRHLLGLAGCVGLKTVAEWVETAAEAALLEAQGVDCLQGYHLGAPAIEPPWQQPRRARAALAAAAG